MMDTAIVLPYRRGTLPLDHCEAYTKRIAFQTSVHLVRAIKRLPLSGQASKEKGLSRSLAYWVFHGESHRL